MKHLFGPSPGSCPVHPLFYRVVAFTAEVQPDVAAELLVSDAVDERTEQTWKHPGNQEAAEEDLGTVLGRHGDQNDVDEGRDVRQHADEELDSVQQDGVAGVPGRGLVRTRSCPGSTEDLQVGDDQNQEDKGKPKHLRGRGEATKAF